MATLYIHPIEEHISTTSVADVYGFYDADTTRTEQTISGSSVPASGTLQAYGPTLLTGTGQDASITCGGNSRTIVFGDGTPSSGQVVYNKITGLMKFHSADAGTAIVLTCYPYATPVRAYMLEHLQDKANNLPPLVVQRRFAGLQSAATGAGDAFTVNLPVSVGTWRVTGLVADAQFLDTGGPSSGDTTVVVAASYTGSPSTNYWTGTISTGAKAVKVESAANGNLDVNAATDATFALWLTEAGHWDVDVTIALTRVS